MPFVNLGYNPYDMQEREEVARQKAIEAQVVPNLLLSGTLAGLEIQNKNFLANKEAESKMNLLKQEQNYNASLKKAQEDFLKAQALNLPETRRLQEMEIENKNKQLSLLLDEFKAKKGQQSVTNALNFTKVDDAETQRNRQTFDTYYSKVMSANMQQLNPNILSDLGVKAYSAGPEQVRQYLNYLRGFISARPELFKTAEGQEQMRPVFNLVAQGFNQQLKRIEEDKKALAVLAQNDPDAANSVIQSLNSKEQQLRQAASYFMRDINPHSVVGDSRSTLQKIIGSPFSDLVGGTAAGIGGAALGGKIGGMIGLASPIPGGATIGSILGAGLGVTSYDLFRRMYGQRDAIEDAIGPAVTMGALTSVGGAVIPKIMKGGKAMKAFVVKGKKKRIDDLNKKLDDILKEG